MTKLYFLVLAAIVVIAAVTLYQYSASKSAAPRIEVTPTFYDFGDIPYEAVGHTFSVKNRGGSVLEIAGISTSCGCTKGTIDKELIGPGETANLLVTIDPNLMGEEFEGKMERTVYIKSNDPDNPEIEIGLTANIIR